MRELPDSSRTADHEEADQFLWYREDPDNLGWPDDPRSIGRRLAEVAVRAVIVGTPVALLFAVAYARSH